jgi:hypothetical protein
MGMDEYGFPSVDPDLCVCADCFEDEGLKAFIKAHADATECSFCGAASDDDIAAHLEEVVDHIRSCLGDDYDNPDNAGMVYDSAEGGYQGEVWDTHEFVQYHLELELPKDSSGELLEAICDGLGDQPWCSAHLYSLGPDAALAYSWDGFCSIVKHKSRYFFSQTDIDDDHEMLNPAALLSTIVNYAHVSGLVRTVPPGATYYRARFQPAGALLAQPDELGPPPPEIAIQNRMSPAGIVMTYVSEEAQTALHEAANTPGTYAIGTFRTRRDIVILDLAELPPVPSLFQELPDTLEYNPRRTLRFLHHLAREISRPIARDDRVHVEYVPTQVVTEYVRSAVLPGDKRLDGVRYQSARRRGGNSLVLFADARNLAGRPRKGYPRLKADEWLELTSRTEEKISARGVRKIEISAGARSGRKERKSRGRHRPARR